MSHVSRGFGLACSLVLFASVCQAGVVYSAEMERLGKKTEFEVSASDKMAKFSVLHGDDPSMPTGLTVIALDRGKRYIVLIPGQGRFIELTKEQFRQFKGKQVRDSGLVFQSGKIEELIADKDGGLVAGIRTRYRKLKIVMTGLKQGKKLKLVAIEEFWTAPSIPTPGFSLDMLTAQTSGISELDALTARKTFQGCQLKRSVQISINGEFTGSSVVEIKTILQQRVPDSVFQTPPSYKQLEIPSQPTVRE
jgi:hypothetical protein